MVIDTSYHPAHCDDSLCDVPGSLATVSLPTDHPAPVTEERHCSLRRSWRGPRGIDDAAHRDVRDTPSVLRIRPKDNRQCTWGDAVDQQL